MLDEVAGSSDTAVLRSADWILRLGVPLVGVYLLFATAREVLSEELPVPSATIWLDMARLFNGG